MCYQPKHIFIPGALSCSTRLSIFWFSWRSKVKGQRSEFSGFKKSIFCSLFLTYKAQCVLTKFLQTSLMIIKKYFVHKSKALYVRRNLNQKDIFLLNLNFRETEYFHINLISRNFQLKDKKFVKWVFSWKISYFFREIGN